MAPDHNEVLRGVDPDFAIRLFAAISFRLSLTCDDETSDRCADAVADAFDPDMTDAGRASALALLKYHLRLDQPVEFRGYAREEPADG